MKSFHDWIHDHDDRWSFLAPYIGGAILLSIFMSLFWVAMLMFCHFLLEVWRHRLLEIKNPLIHALWHTKLDFSLVIVAFVIAVYADVIIGALGLGQAARAGQVAARFGVIERSIRSILLTADEAGLFLRALAKGRKKQTAAVDTVLQEASGQSRDPQMRKDVASHIAMANEDDAPWRSPTKGDWFSLGFGGLCVTLILMAPMITAHDFSDIGQIILHELQP